MNFLKSTFLLLVPILFLAACNKNSSSLSTDAVDSLKLTYQQITVDVEQAWVDMIMDDDGKLENMRRILQEVGYSDSYNRLKFDSLNKEVDALAQLRYDQESMSDSDLITLYDERTGTTLGKLMTFTTSLPQFEQYPLMGTLLQEIFEADDRVLRYRIQYDNAAKSYNQFITDHESNLGLLTSQEIHHAKALFELPE